MKKMALTVAALIAPLALMSLPARAADVGISISFSQPGIAGRVDIGRFPQPELVGPTAVVAVPRGAVHAEPVYMWVPPEERLNWGRYCGRYHACGVPVYFVRDEWYHGHVQPHAHERRHAPPPPHGHDEHHDHDRDDHGRGHDDHGHS